MGNDCLGQKKNPERKAPRTTKEGKKPFLNHPQGYYESPDQTHQEKTSLQNTQQAGLLGTQRDGSIQETNRGDSSPKKTQMKYSHQLKQKKAGMIEKQRKIINEKKTAVIALQTLLHELEAAGDIDHSKEMKLKRQIQVNEDLIAQHRKNIEKIENN